MQSINFYSLRFFSVFRLVFSSILVDLDIALNDANDNFSFVSGNDDLM